MFKLILISAVLLGLGFAGIAVKIWAKKDGQFDGTCSSRRANGTDCACQGNGHCENEHHHDDEHIHDTPVLDIKKIS